MRKHTHEANYQLNCCQPKSITALSDFHRGPQEHLGAITLLEIDWKNSKLNRMREELSIRYYYLCH